MMLLSTCACTKRQEIAAAAEEGESGLQLPLIVVDAVGGGMARRGGGSPRGGDAELAGGAEEEDGGERVDPVKAREIERRVEKYLIVRLGAGSAARSLTERLSGPRRGAAGVLACLGYVLLLVSFVCTVSGGLTAIIFACAFALFFIASAFV